MGYGSVYLEDRQVAHMHHRPDRYTRQRHEEADLHERPYRVRVGYAEQTGRVWFRVEWKKYGPDVFDWREIDPHYLSPHLK